MKLVKRLFAIFIVIVLVFSMYYSLNTSYASALNNKTAIYIWNVNNIDYSKFNEIADYLNLNKIYAYIGTTDIENKIDNDVRALFEFANRKNISLYIVYDENYEDQTENSRRLKELIDEVKNHNASSEYKIAGIAVDSEFYSMDGYSALSQENKIRRFKDYVVAMKTAYSYANQFGIEYVVCIPVWLDKLDSEELESLIKDGSDYVQMMNYAKSKMVENISEEIALAKKYNKPIENIAEFQQPGPHEVTEDITFYSDGIEACNSKFKQIENEYNYGLLSFAYHYLEPIMEIYNPAVVNTTNPNTANNTVSNTVNNNIINNTVTNNTINNNVVNSQLTNTNIVNNVQTNNNVTNGVRNNTTNTKDNSIAPKMLPNAGDSKIILFVIFLMILLSVYYIGKNIKNNEIK